MLFKKIFLPGSIIRNPNEIQVTKKPKPVKEDTRKISFDFYKSGKAVEEIAGLRGLHKETVMGHLTTFIRRGEIKVEEIVPVARIQQIISAIHEVGKERLGEIKRALPDDFSYGEITAVVACNERLGS